MSCYFFDFFDGRDEFRDELGLEADSGEEALQEAVAALNRMASECRKPVSGHTLSMSIRDDTGCPLYLITHTISWSVLSYGSRIH
jgi:hypothetical protein